MPASIRLRPTVPAALAVVLVAAAAVTAACSPDLEPDPAASCIEAPDRPLTGTAGPSAEAPDGGGLRVVESGVTIVPPVRRPGSATASIGVIVENTSGYVAYRTRVSFDVRDGAGDTVVVGDGGGTVLLEVPLLLPGARSGVGTAVYVDEAADAADRVEVDTTLGATTWVEHRPDEVAGVTTTHDRTTIVDAESHSGIVYYRMASPYCTGLFTRGVGTIFRDATGQIVGGSIDGDKGSRRCDPDQAEQLTDVIRSIPAQFDDSRTESYPYCDFGPAPSSPGWATTAPFN
ncbi:hypothetical protein ACN27J_26625 [Solwaraspora sp. WMMB762]|uniref:hypothetical protein n=1 Tax=Solwaraspora sp. WMMB762 TaxID=3404120 RepID=UPI003B92637E